MQYFQKRLRVQKTRVGSRQKNEVKPTVAGEITDANEPDQSDFDISSVAAIVAGIEDLMATTGLHLGLLHGLITPAYVTALRTVRPGLGPRAGPRGKILG